ncbi:hypothetical protein OIDMADRAFT_146000 [Oidiodendron maius Zn]|uniref:Kinesin light chain n=1 Tax=Oidiodendron maius (strain Zn) TaxID=913774 RepID=A0A0C3CND3_OIDMZ|nr:hypothetical protein OIDMADRAFT_146000 [Oidiodendron maius Zn]
MSSCELGSLVKLADQSILTLGHRGVGSKTWYFLISLRKSLESCRVQKAESEEKRRRPGHDLVIDYPAQLPTSGVVGSYSTRLVEVTGIVREKKLRPSKLNELGYLSERLSLAKVLIGEGNYHKAMTTYESVLVGFRQKLGANHPDTLECVRLIEEAQRLSYPDMESCCRTNDYALELLSENELDEAISEFESALAGFKKILGDNHVYTLTCLLNIG